MQTIFFTFQETNIFYRLAEPSDSSTPSGKVIFLLHGAAFTSETWEKEIGTIQTMASLGKFFKYFIQLFEHPIPEYFVCLLFEYFFQIKVLD